MSHYFLTINMRIDVSLIFLFFSRHHIFYRYGDRAKRKTLLCIISNIHCISALNERFLFCTNLYSCVDVLYYEIAFVFRNYRLEYHRRRRRSFRDLRQLYFLAIRQDTSDLCNVVLYNFSKLYKVIRYPYRALNRTA